MRHQKFVIATTVVMLAFSAVVVGLAFYSTHVARASAPNLPHSIHYLPASSNGIFGMNVQKFIQSPLYQRIQAKQGDRIGQDLQDFIAKTGVDPTKDVQYIIAAGRPGEGKGGGVAVVVGSRKFDTDKIMTFITTNTKTAPIETPYKKGKVIMIPESDGTKLEKGIAFLSDIEIAMGDLDSLKAVLDIQAGDAAGIDTTSLGALVTSLDPNEMFWFAGDPGAVMAKNPTGNPLVGNLSAIRSIYGTLDMSTAIVGNITATTADADSANKLVSVINGFVALGSLAASQSNQSQEFKNLIGQIVINAKADINNEKKLYKVLVSLNVPFDVLGKLEQAKSQFAPRSKTE